LKDRNIDRDARVAVTVVDSQNPYRVVTVRGVVVEKLGPDEGATDHIHMLAQKYMGRDRYALRDGERRVLFRIRPTHVRETGAGDRATWRSRGTTTPD
jgi:hypothetical protein